MSKGISKSDQLRALREARAARSSDGGVGNRRHATEEAAEPQEKIRSRVGRWPSSTASPETKSNLREHIAGVASGPSDSNPRAKATKGKAGTAEVNGLVRRSTAGTGLQVGVTGADQSQRGRGRPKASGPREWDKLGISERTYYRRKAVPRSKVLLA